MTKADMIREQEYWYRMLERALPRRNLGHNHREYCRFAIKKIREWQVKLYGGS